MAKYDNTINEILAMVSKEAESKAPTDLDPGSAHASDLPMEDGGQHAASTGATYDRMTTDVKNDQPGNSVDAHANEAPILDGEVRSPQNGDGKPTGSDPENERPSMADKPTDIEPGTSHAADISKLATADLEKLAGELTGELGELLKAAGATPEQPLTAAAQAGYQAAAVAGGDAAIRKAAAARVVADVIKQADLAADLVAARLSQKRAELEAEDGEDEQTPPAEEKEPAADGGGGSAAPPESMTPPSDPVPPPALPPGAADPAMAGGMPPGDAGAIPDAEIIQELVAALVQSGVRPEELMALAGNAGSPEQAADVKIAAVDALMLLKSGGFVPGPPKTAAHKVARERLVTLISELRSRNAA